MLKGVSVEDHAARKPHSALAEQLRALRAGLSLWPDRPRIIAVTAARPKEGKTTVTRALARLAAMNGEHVIVLDCDIRHPSYSAPTRSRAWWTICASSATLAEVIRKDTATGVDSIAERRTARRMRSGC